MVIAQHGTRQSPCTFLDVTERESYSSTLNRHFRHRVLSIGFHFDGPTEIGGLVVDPGSRGGPDLPGKQLSLVRFLYMAMFPERFRDTVLAELMPPLAKDGKSLFWESFGRRFTGLDYQDADKLSRRGKEFIQQLFPAGEFYATLLPPRVQRALGKVGRSTEGARRMLARIGFRSVDRIDPFDGGPHYEAEALGDLGGARAPAAHRRGDGARAGAEGIRRCWRGSSGRRVPDRFRAVRTRARVSGQSIRLPAEARRLLGVKQGDQSTSSPSSDAACGQDRPRAGLFVDFPFFEALARFTAAARRAASSASRPQGSMSSGLSWASSGGRKKLVFISFPPPV